MSQGFFAKYFNWWMGVVEDRNDPLKLGRCKVRIVGLHDEDKVKLKTADLPWTAATESINGANMFNPPKEGDYVWGFFMDQQSSQVPIMAGLLPGINTTLPDKSGSTIPLSEYPRSPDALGGELGKPTTAPVAYGELKASAIARANANLEHVCDFKFQINFSFIFGGLLNPAAEFSKAIRNGKLKAAALIRSFLQQINDKLRLALKAILKAIGFDPSGEWSYAFSQAKKVINTINYYIKKIAQYIEDIAFYIYLVKEIQQLIEYLNSLPDRIKALIKQCLLDFQNSITNLADQVKAIPGQIATEIQLAVGDLKTVAEGLINDKIGEQEATTLPAEIQDILNSTTPTQYQADTLTIFFETERYNANLAIQQTTVDNQYVRLALQSP